MEKHGLVTWGETSETCYQKTISIIQEAEQYVNDRINQHEVFGGKRYQRCRRIKENKSWQASCL